MENVRDVRYVVFSESWQPRFWWRTTLTLRNPTTERMQRAQEWIERRTVESLFPLLTLFFLLIHVLRKSERKNQ